jgi:hemoglobin
MTEASLYNRLGGEERIRDIVTTIFNKHQANPAVNVRYADSDPDEVIRLVTEFVCSGTGGPQAYTGKDMVAAHRGMNINEQEYLAVLDDIVESLQEHGVGQREQEELLMTCYSLKGDIVRR